MSSPFSRTLRALEAERARGWRPAAIAAALLLAWAGWFVLARVPLYETSRVARVEASAAAHPVDARMLGRAVYVNLVIGTRVRAGDLLVELESEPERRASPCLTRSAPPSAARSPRRNGRSPTSAAP